MRDKLLKIQSELVAPKSNFNKFGNYSYRSCEDILSAVKPLCVENKVVLTLTDEIVEVGGRVYVKAVATIQDIETDGYVSVSAYARESETRKGMDDSQITGSTLSYARKYALNGLFCIDDTKDADTMPPPEKEDKPVSKTDKIKALPENVKDGLRVMGYGVDAAYAFCEKYKWDNAEVMKQLNILADGKS